MKFLKSLNGLPAPLLNALLDMYEWGFDDAKNNKEKKGREELKQSLNNGFLVGLKNRKV